MSGKNFKCALACVAFFAVAGSLAGCERACDKLIQTVCEDWEEPQKCAEWTEIANTAGEESCAESLKRLEDYEP